LPGDAVFAIAQARDGAIAFGTNKGVGIFDGDGWTTFTDSLPDLAVRSLLQDRHGVWWIVTEGGGLARYGGARWSVLTQASGNLPSNQVRALLED
jgi:ligand-binding sensor domain-containing protein